MFELGRTSITLEVSEGELFPVGMTFASLTLHVGGAAVRCRGRVRALLPDAGPNGSTLCEIAQAGHVGFPDGARQDQRA